MVKIDFDSVTPAVPVVTKTYAEKFMEAVEKNPVCMTLRFKKSYDDYDAVVKFYYKKGTEPIEVITSRISADLITVILSAFNGDYSKIKDFVPADHELLQVEEDEDLRMELYKTFLNSPYPAMLEQPYNSCWCMKFMLGKSEVAFCLPDYQESYRLFKEAKERKKAS